MGASVGAWSGAPINSRLGSRGDGLNYYDGKLDDVLFYDRVLTISEVAVLFSR